jgi:2-haloacid dehalogenase
MDIAGSSYRSTADLDDPILTGIQVARCLGGCDAGGVAYLAPSTGRTVRAVLFDVFGTVVDWRTGIAEAVGSFAGSHGLELDPHAFADSWRAQYRPAMQRVRSGERPFVSLDVLHRENLDGALRELGLDPGDFDPKELDALALAWHFLPPWPDSVAGISAIKRGYIVGPLSNGNTSLLLDMAKAGGLPWDLVLGSDVSRAYKPDPEAYLRPAALLALEPGEVMLAAAHEGDLAAARKTGLATAFIARPLEHGPGTAETVAATADWDLVGGSIPEIADLL